VLEKKTPTSKDFLLFVLAFGYSELRNCFFLILYL